MHISIYVPDDYVHKDSFYEGEQPHKEYWI